VACGGVVLRGPPQAVIKGVNVSNTVSINAIRRKPLLRSGYIVFIGFIFAFYKTLCFNVVYDLRCCKKVFLFNISPKSGTEVLLPVLVRFSFEEN
jgi:hypothetical protein